MRNSIETQITPMSEIFSVCLALVLTTPFYLHGQAGSFDPEFGENGVVFTAVRNQNSYTTDIDLTIDQRILSIGSLSEHTVFILRQDMQGKVDSAFGINGVTTLPFSALNVFGAFVKSTSEGFIYAGGYGNTGSRDHAFIMRLQNDGSPDSTFANTGAIILNQFGTSTYAYDAVAYDDGRLLVAGATGFLGERYLIVRYLETGVPDPSFNNTGYVELDMFGDFDNPTNIYLLPDEKILIIGRSINLNDPLETLITAVRLFPDGSVDESFGELGRQFINLSDYENHTFGAILEEDGKILIGGNAGNHNLNLIRLTENGEFDSTFGIEGFVSHDIISSEVNVANAFAKQSDGRIVMAGINGNVGALHTSLIRMNEDGSIDTTFGVDGFALHDIGDSTNYWAALHILPDDRLLVAGVVNTNGLRQHVLGVVLPDSVKVYQPFAPVGASWVHCLQPDIEPGQHHIRVESTEITTFQGMTCSILRSPDFWKLGSTTLDSMLVCSDADKVYYAEGDSLHLLYDFSLQAGDTLTIRFPIEMDAYYQEWFPNASLFWSYLIEDVDTVLLDGIPLKRQHLFHFNIDPYFNVYPGNWAIERIGYEQWVFPFMSVGESNAYCYLVEYQDDQIHEANTTNQCMAVGTQDLPVSTIKVDVWPNPCTDHVFVESEDEILDIRLFGLEGEFISRELQMPMSVAGLPSGIYVLEVVFYEGIEVRKLVKN